MTPSGFNIGIILKTNVFLNYSAISLLLRRNLIIPSTMKLPLVSPGWTLPVIITQLHAAISCSYESKFVIRRHSKSLPATVFPRHVFRIIDLFFGVTIDLTRYQRSVKV